jgi:hypothetical protein
MELSRIHLAVSGQAGENVYSESNFKDESGL